MRACICLGQTKGERGARHPDVGVLYAGGLQAACLEVLSNCPSVSCSPATELVQLPVRLLLP